jgi:hypothetical protein
MNRKIIPLVISFLFLGIVYAQQTPEELVDQFFNKYQTSGVLVALDQLYATNPWMKSNKDALEKVKSQLADFVKLVGKYYNREFIVKKELGSSYVLLSYLVKYDRQPVRFTFEFYKPQNNWRIYSFAYDDSFDTELEEAAKIYYLKEINP